MTKIAISPNASGTGTFTIAAPNSNVDRTFSLPDATGEVLTDQSDIAAAKLTGDVAAGRITTALNAGGSAPIYACRAWVNFNGTGTVAIRASGNVSSVTDNGVGDYTVNFTTAMPDANFAVQATSNAPSGGGANRCIVEGPNGTSARTVSAVRIGVGIGGTATLTDVDFINVSVFR